MPCAKARKAHSAAAVTTRHDACGACQGVARDKGLSNPAPSDNLAMTTMGTKHPSVAIYVHSALGSLNLSVEAWSIVHG